MKSIAAIAVALTAAVSPAAAQEDRRYVDEPTAGLHLPTTPLAGDHDARALVLNPGAIEAMQGHDLMRQRAQKVIDEQLNPMLSSHGGWVDIQASDAQDLYISMAGGCQGCHGVSGQGTQEMFALA